MAQKSSERYWEKRRGLEDKARLKMEQDMLKSLTANLPDVLKKIQAELLFQADLHGMTQQELLEDYSLRDQKKYRKYIDKNYKELMKSDKKYQEFIDEYFPPYDYAKVNRLLQMRSDIFNIMASEMIKTDPNKKFNDGLEEIINKTYNSNSNALMHLLGPGDFNPLPKKELENMLNYPWSGKTFSNRLWGNISRLEQNLSNAIVNSVASGQGVEEALKTMKLNPEINDMFKLEGDKFKRAIDNLVRTEYAHFAVEGLRKSMSDAGIKDTQSWSAEDERVCSICGGRHGKVIKDDWHPPYHGRCRCTEIPKMPELGEDIDKLYDEMFGDLLDEFAKDKFGIKLNKPKKKTNLADLIKKDDYLNKQAKQLNEYSQRINKLTQDLNDASEKYDKLGTIEAADEYNAFVREYRSLLAEKDEFMSNYVRNNADRVREVLSEQRSFGIQDLNMKDHITNQRAQMSKVLMDAYEYYPTDWIKRSIDYGTMTTKKVKRGYYQHGKVAELAISEKTGLYSPFRTAIHELAHRQEYINADILNAEKEFFLRRTAGEEYVKLRDVTKINYQHSEITKVDNFIDPYMGKDYGGQAYELLSMGLETLYAEPMKLAKDEDMLNWVVDMILKM